jgi:thioester reductase-like protein
VYQNPTLHSLASFIADGQSADPRVSLEKEALLPDHFLAFPRQHYVVPQAVLLTGATGFVGRFILAQLLEDTKSTIYCLVRARSDHDALSRIKATQLKWGLWRRDDVRRIVPVTGDLRLPRLGIEPGPFQKLCRDVDVIYHCATSMNHLETYAAAKPANVESAVELLKLATQGKPKLINYISTLGVFSSVTPGTIRVVDEQTPIGQETHLSSSGYLASKWVAEGLFMKAQQAGLACNLFRLGVLWADTQQGRFDELQYIHRLFKSCLLCGYGIEDYRFDLPPTPVDYMARSVVYLGTRQANGHGKFHISSPEPTFKGAFERCNQMMGTSLRLLPFYEWIGQIKRLYHEGRSLPIVPLVEFAFSMDRESFYNSQRSAPWTNIRFDCTRTHRELEQARIVAPALTEAMLGVCLERLLLTDDDLREVPQPPFRPAIPPQHAAARLS